MKNFGWFSGVWQVVSKQVPEMDNGSATEALWERIAWMEEVLGEWPSEDGSVTSWVEHTMKEIQLQRSLPKTHDQFFEEKVASLKVDI